MRKVVSSGVRARDSSETVGLRRCASGERRARSVPSWYGGSEYQSSIGHISTSAAASASRFASAASMNRSPISTFVPTNHPARPGPPVHAHACFTLTATLRARCDPPLGQVGEKGGDSPPDGTGALPAAANVEGPDGAPERRSSRAWGCASACPRVIASMPAPRHRARGRRIRGENHVRAAHQDRRHADPPHRHQGGRLEHPGDRRSHGRAARHRVDQRLQGSGGHVREHGGGGQRQLHGHRPARDRQLRRRARHLRAQRPFHRRHLSVVRHQLRHCADPGLAAMGRRDRQAGLLGAGALVQHPLSERRVPVVRREDPGAARAPGSCDELDTRAP
ncbi:hypothetical protein MICRO8M_130176 [Microbacterium sp. 8M]|nr:hypothetical protein MICRO8M_130176 [Microbacterium sp. 8M]